MASSFEHAGAQLAAIAAQQKALATAVASGQLWMDADVAERAAARCEQAVEELDASLRHTYELTRLRRFGDNEDGHAAATRFAEAGQDYIKTMRNVQEVFRNMAATYRAAGRTVAETEAANEQLFRGRSL
jgi:ABC-type nitrate/sulfonate/bicarbonate transport system substrate-binding protein